MKFTKLLKYPVFPLFIVGGIALVIVGIFTDPKALTDDGYSLRWFWICLGSFYEVLVLIVLFGIYFLLSKNEKRVDWFKKNGILREAKIIEASSTGTFINNNPVVDFILEIKDNDGNYYTVSHKECVDLLNLNSINKNSIIKVLVSPVKKEDIMVLF
ncbi:hypothetical protein A2316_02675 [Candidatus Falkowbacteria bacterium RIFOXYB2_FULL_38_15]|uniref:Uncharacterized protein n=1 Tax=Candidatus Falkowbacteria bacterium RIFOXYA2_FULL_38_12 TaxID=1797993 RepID=A0A1F5S250_9BACT|nr:MAG: hypothetical protein A2257_02995 [Candidatus Falkowbacteria bacterium RIFOXYA2_FULL_38_12]OGF32553.1 MAG: hypothetical protein A2316_02675 [Candidatus Falkowbacteria bacterium RIFOXYB2_FULL_38_15]OGF41981.1 MAG: hypothetical protein A2555_03955 [Candidatus Falkowbacteria bacterium RIFOXYD2_FULL_39_16]